MRKRQVRTVRLDQGGAKESRRDETETKDEERWEKRKEKDRGGSRDP